MELFTFRTFKMLISENTVKVWGSPVKSTRPWKEWKLQLHEGLLKQLLAARQLISPLLGSPPKMFSGSCGEEPDSNPWKGSRRALKKTTGVGTPWVHVPIGRLLLPDAHLCECFTQKEATELSKVAQVTEAVVKTQGWDLEIQEDHGVVISLTV